MLSYKEYSVKQFLLSPNQFGVPNSRLRFYLLARKLKFAITENKINTNDLNTIDNNIEPKDNIMTSPDFFINEGIISKETTYLPKLQEYLNYDINEETSKKDFLIPIHILNKESTFAIDIVTIESSNTNCFTKGYGKFIKGTGSTLLLDKNILYVKKYDNNFIE